MTLRKKVIMWEGERHKEREKVLIEGRRECLLRLLKTQRGDGSRMVIVKEGRKWGKRRKDVKLVRGGTVARRTLIS